VTIDVAGDGEGAETISGRVIGVDISYSPKSGPGDPQNLTKVLTIAADDGQVRFFPLDGLRGLTIHDGQSAQDLGYFLDTSMQEGNQRGVHVRLTEGDHDLVVQYVAPSPTWRVSYRVVAESKEDGSGRALVQGWGLFDNRLEEDLENVQVTLVAGQPISFIYELYASRIPERPLVQDETRVAPGPVRVAGGMPAPQPKPAKLRTQSGAGSERERGFAARLSTDESDVATSALRSVVGYGGAELAMAMEMEDVAGSIGQTAEASESGEFFQYRVATLVSARRGESAMVPILSAEIGYQRELVYNGAKLPAHPVASLRFMNATGLTLESGPVTVSEDGDYRGEAVVPFTKDGNEVYLPYAVELGVTITEKPTSYRVTSGMHIKDVYLIHEQYQVNQVEYVVENTTAGDLSIMIEAAQMTDFEPFEMAAPDAETARERRWRVAAPARSKISFLRQERARTQRSEYLRGLRLEQLQEYLKNKWLDQKTFDMLAGLLDVLRSIERMQGDVEQIRAQRQQLFEQQAQLRENLNALHGGGDEITLRAKMVNRLEKAQDQIDALEIQEGALNLQIQEAEARVDQIIAGLGKE
jgi:hypothetical protein